MPKLFAIWGTMFEATVKWDIWIFTACSSRL